MTQWKSRLNFFRTFSPMASSHAVGLALPDVRSASPTMQDSREVHATPNVWRFLVIAAELAVLFFVFRLYHLEKRDFQLMSAIVYCAFLVHYWLPFRLKEPFWVVVSMASAFVVLEPRIAGLVIGVGLVILLVLRTSIAFRWRVLAVAAIFACLIYFQTAAERVTPAASALFDPGG